MGTVIVLAVLRRVGVDSPPCVKSLKQTRDGCNSKLVIVTSRLVVVAGDREADRAGQRRRQRPNNTGRLGVAGRLLPVWPCEQLALCTPYIRTCLV